MHHVALIERPYGGFGVYRVVMTEDRAPEPVMSVDVDTADAAARLAEWWEYAV